jgi:hypothetical protein
MNKITIRYSHDNYHPWRILDVDNKIIYHSKKLKMEGVFKGVSKFESFSEIETFGYYERSEIAAITDPKHIDKKFLISKIMEIDEITVYGKKC